MIGSCAFTPTISGYDANDETNSKLSGILYGSVDFTAGSTEMPSADVHSSVYPSGFARATRSMPIADAAPGLFSTTTLWLNSFDS